MRDRLVDDVLDERGRKDPLFQQRRESIEQKADIVVNIISYRHKYKLNQTSLAKRIGVSQQHISKIEGGEFSNIATLERVLNFIGYTVKMEAVPMSRKAKEAFRKAHSNGKNGKKAA